MSISFSVKDPQTFRESRMSLPNMPRTISNMCAYPVNQQFVIKTSWSHDKKPNDQRNFYTWTVIFSVDEGIQSFLDCFSTGGWEFILNTSSSSVVFACWRPFFAIFKCSNWQCHYTFSSVSSFNNLLIKIWIFKDINLLCVWKVYCVKEGQHLM